MKEEKKRSYRSEGRESQAFKTRITILESAKKLFQMEGFDRVTINKIAEAANVSIPTVYAIFKSKRGVLQALIDSALPSEKFEAIVEEAMQEKNPRKKLDITAKLARHIYDAERGLIDILRDAYVVAAEFRELEQEREKRRYERQLLFIKEMFEESSLAKGLTLNKARDILWTLTGREIYRMIVIEREWNSDEYERWLAELLAKSLLK